MIKGIQKQMVMVRLHDNTAFETAYFVLRDGSDKKSDSDIVAEANTLVQSAFTQGNKKPKDSRISRFRSLLLFFLGLLLGALISSILWLILTRI